MPMKSKEMVKLLKSNDFEWISTNGSHQKFRHRVTGKIVIVPMHSKDLKKGTEENILKQAGLK